MLKLCRFTKVKVFFLVLVYVFNFDLFEFLAAILDKGLFFRYHENHQMMEWAQMFVLITLTFFRWPAHIPSCCCTWLQVKFIVKVWKGKEADKCVKNNSFLFLTHLSVSFLFPTLRLNLTYNQLTTAWRNVGRSAKENGSGRRTNIPAQSMVKWFL